MNQQDVKRPLDQSLTALDPLTSVQVNDDIVRIEKQQTSQKAAMTDGAVKESGIDTVDTAETTASTETRTTPIQPRPVQPLPARPADPSGPRQQQVASSSSGVPAASNRPPPLKKKKKEPSLFIPKKRPFQPDNSSDQNAKRRQL